MIFTKILPGKRAVSFLINTRIMTLIRVRYHAAKLLHQLLHHPVALYLFSVFWFLPCGGRAHFHRLAFDAR
ncbi:MAG: hypothetical protein ACR5LD_12000, partial [Symbiopectobacterium sp.]